MFMIKKVVFMHYKQVYEFLCDLSKLETMAKDKHLHPMAAFLLDKILLGNVPTALFNSPNATKVSDIKPAIEKSDLQILQKILRAENLVNIVKDNHFSVYTEYVKRFPKPQRKQLFHYFLIKHPDTFAAVVPVWSFDRQIVGHIDLLSLDKNNGQVDVFILKYIRRGNPIRIIPQVLVYYQLLQSLVPSLENKFVCGILTDKGIYRFKPSQKLLNFISKFMSLPGAFSF